MPSHAVDTLEVLAKPIAQAPEFRIFHAAVAHNLRPRNHLANPLRGAKAPSRLPASLFLAPGQSFGPFDRNSDLAPTGCSPSASSAAANCIATSVMVHSMASLNQKYALAGVALALFLTSGAFGAVFESSPRRYLTPAEEEAFGAVNKVSCPIGNGHRIETTSALIVSNRIAVTVAHAFYNEDTKNAELMPTDCEYVVNEKTTASLIESRSAQLTRDGWRTIDTTTAPKILRLSSSSDRRREPLDHSGWKQVPQTPAHRLKSSAFTSISLEASAAFTRKVKLSRKLALTMLFVAQF